MNLTGLLQRFANFTLSSVRTNIPAKVISFDATNLTVNVQVLIQGKRISKDGTLQQMETGELVLAENFTLLPILNVPISIICQAGFGIKIPIRAGAIGTLIVCDRDISQFKKSQSLSPQASLRKFDLNDSIFLPFLLTKGSIADYGNDAVEVFYGATKLKVKESGVEITGDLTISGDATIGGIPFSTHIHPYLNGTTPSQTGTPET
jgi:hypothetical protein